METLTKLPHFSFRGVPNVMLTFISWRKFSQIFTQEVGKKLCKYQSKARRNFKPISIDLKFNGGRLNAASAVMSGK